MNITKTLNTKYPKIFEFFVEFLLKKQIEEDFIPNGYTFFRNPNEVKDWGINFLEYFEHEEKVYYLSTSDRDYKPFIVFKYYAGNFFRSINGFLRERIDSNDNEFITRRIDVIKREISKFELDDNIVVVRRMSNYLLKNYILKNDKLKKGSTMMDKDFLSTSINLNYRMDIEGNYKPLNNEVLLFIKISRGTNAMYLEPISKRKEFEIILPNDLELIVEKQVKILNNIVIFARVMP